MRSLIEGGLMVTSIRDGGARPKQGFAPMRIGTIAVGKLALYTRQFGAMLRAGLDIMHTLDTLEQQIPDGRLQRISREMRHRVSSGEPLARAMGRHPLAFSKIYVTMVQMGEEGGRLDEVLDRLADWLESEADLKRFIKSRMIYPMLILGFAFFTVLVAFPVIARVFGTQWMPAWIFSLTWIVLWAVIILVVLFQFANVQKALMEFLKRMPVFGPVMQRIMLRRFAITLATMLETGVPLLKALDISRQTINDWRLEWALTSIYRRVSTEGISLGQAMRISHAFPPEFNSMMQVGEEAGSPESMLFKIAEYYDSMIRSSTHGIIAVMRVLIILLIAVFVGAILVAFYSNYTNVIFGAVGV